MIQVQANISYHMSSCHITLHVIMSHHITCHHVTSHYMSSCHHVTSPVYNTSNENIRQSSTKNHKLM